MWNQNVYIMEYANPTQTILYNWLINQKDIDKTLWMESVKW